LYRRLKLQYDEPLSNFAFNVNLRHRTEEAEEAEEEAEEVDAEEAELELRLAGSLLPENSV